MFMYAFAVDCSIYHIRRGWGSHLAAPGCVPVGTGCTHWPSLACGSPPCTQRLPTYCTMGAAAEGATCGPSAARCTTRLGAPSRGVTTHMRLRVSIMRSARKPRAGDFGAINWLVSGIYPVVHACMHNLHECTFANLHACLHDSYHSSIYCTSLWSFDTESGQRMHACTFAISHARLHGS